MSPTECDGLPPAVIGGGGRLVIDDGITDPIADRFVQLAVAPCTVLGVSDSGYDVTYPFDGRCQVLAPTYQKIHSDTVQLSSGRYRTYQSNTGSQCNVPGTGVVTVQKVRGITCPQGYKGRTNASGELECFIPASCGPAFGNPICAADGVKKQAENDYRSAGIGGLEFTRYFNSAGYYHPSASSFGAGNYSDYWRHSYDRRVIPADVNPYTVASTQRPDGTIEDFDANGRPLQNYTGAGDVLSAITSNGQVTGWQLTLADSSVEIYSADGKLQTTTTREGLTTALAYDTAGNLVTVTDQFGHSLTLSYDAENRLQSMTDPAGNPYAYGYDDSGHMTSVTYPGNRVRTYVYEDPANPDFLTGVVDEETRRFSTFAYDSTGRGISTQHAGGADLFSFAYSGSSTTVTDPLGTHRIYTFADAAGILKIGSVSQPSVVSGNVASTTTYDVNGNVSSRIDFNGNKTTYVFDLTRNLETSRTEGLTSAGNPTSVTRTTTTQWHPTFRLPTQITQPSGVPGVDRVTQMTYDGHGNLLTKTVTAGAAVRTWTYTYDSFGRRLTVDGPRTDVSDITTFTYYAANDSCVGCRGQLQTATDAAGHVTHYDQYDGDSRVTQITDANGMVTTLAYDPRGWLLSRTEASGTPQAETTSLSYDNIGQLIRATRPDNSYIAYQYDDAHRLTAVGDSSGNLIEYTLDAQGNRVEEQTFDAQNTLRREQRHVFDKLGHLISDIGAYQEAAQYGYDDNENRVASIDSSGALTSSTFDALNRLTSMIDPLGGPTGYTYDATDALTAVQDASGLSTTYAYNGLGDPLGLTSPDTGQSIYATDDAGNRISQTDARGIATTYTYDSLNRVTQSVAGAGGAAVSVSFAYDQGVNGIGRLSAISGAGSTLNYGYDVLGRVIQKTESVGGQTLTVAYTYAAGRLASMTYPSGAVVSYSYDSSGRVDSIDVAGHPLLSNVSYQPFGDVDQFTFAGGNVVNRNHDLDGRIEQLSLGPAAAIPDAGARTYVYDALNRLTSASLSSTLSLGYAYDAIGDRVQDTVNGAQTLYSYAPLTHRLTSKTGASGATYAYDASGNQITRDSESLNYDARGRMTSVSGGATASYVVNGRGERIQKSNGSVTIRFVYDEAGRLLGEYDGSLVPIQEYVYLNDLPVAVVRPAGVNDISIYQLYADHLGTPRSVIDPARNVEVWRWGITGSAFGDHAADNDPDADGVNFLLNLRFPGQYYDIETALNYNGHRDYESAAGRYVESDPVGLKGGINSYSYVKSNPLINIDKNGLTVWSIYWGVGGGVGHIVLGGSVYQLIFRDPTRALQCSYTVYCAGLGVGLPEFGVISPITHWNDGKSDCSDCRDHEGLGSQGFASAMIGGGVSLGGWIDIPSGPYLTGDFWNWDGGAFRIGTGVNICRFNLN